MFIENVSLRNFLSYGDRPVTYDITRNQTTMINGKNSMGKSSIIDALSFGLYGKAFRTIPKQDLLINDKNKKNMVVVVNLIGSNNKKVKVVRGLKPSIFEIYEDDVLVNQTAKAKEYQLYLEEQILGMNYNIFCQTVIISKTKYTPFMKMKTSERRAFVESVLDLQIFGVMQKTQSKVLIELKKQERELQYQQQIKHNDIHQGKQSVKDFKALLSDMLKEANDSKQEELVRLTDKLSEINQTIEKLQVKIVPQNPHEDSYRKYTQLENILVKKQNQFEQLDRELSRLNGKSDRCQCCGGKIDISHYEEIKLMKLDEINDVKMKISQITVKVDEYKSQDIENLWHSHLSRQSSIQEYITRYKRDMKEIERQIDDIKNKKTNTQPYLDKIENASNKLKKDTMDLKQLNDEFKNCNQLIEQHTIVQSILKDSGIKSAIIQNSIHTINHIINEYLIKFGFMIRFTLDSEFNETLWIRGNDNLCYNSLSEGEKLRIDIALILAWRDVALLQNGISCNLIFFDEMTDASMDMDGVEVFAKTLNSLKDTNSWIITHTPEKMESYVRGLINLEKVDGFTTVSMNK